MFEIGVVVLSLGIPLISGRTKGISPCLVMEPSDGSGFGESTETMAFLVRFCSACRLMCLGIFGLSPWGLTPPVFRSTVRLNSAETFTVTDGSTDSPGSSPLPVEATTECEKVSKEFVITDCIAAWE